MEYKKISDTEFEMKETIVRNIPLSLEKLNFDKESLLRTIDNNNQECTKKNQQCLQMIAEIDKIIIDAKGLGIKEKVAPVIEEVMEA